jgi:hypothetical protein
MAFEEKSEDAVAKVNATLRKTVDGIIKPGVKKDGLGSH